MIETPSAERWRALGHSGVLVVHADPRRPPAPPARMATILSEADHQRLDRLKREEDRERSLLGIALLRLVLADWLSCAPHVVPLARDKNGRPYIDGAPVPVHVSIAHSGRLVLVGFSRFGRVGVDVEAVRPLDDLEDVADRVCSDHERQQLRAFEGEERQHAFYRLWARKEAILKALGIGLAGLHDVECDAGVGTGSVLRALRLAGERAERWVVQSLELPADAAPAYAAAVAAEGTAVIHVEGC